jgi:hypothetical protein
MQVKFQLFKSSMKSWADLCDDAAAFASGKGPERVISLSVSDHNERVIIVWYWE